MAKVCKACMGTGYAHGGEVEDEDGPDEDDAQGREMVDLPPEEDESNESEEETRKKQMGRFAAAMKARKMGRK